MTLRQDPTLDELLRDSLIRAVMRADRVDSRAQRTLLDDAARRLAASRAREPRPARPPVDWRATPWRAGAPGRARPLPLADACGAAFCR